MKIAKIEVGEVRLPLVTPFKTAERTALDLNDLIVRVTADTGETGFGEAPPTAVITGDTKGSIRCAVEEFIAPAILGMDLDCLDEIEARLHSCLVRNTSAKAAVDMALYDLFAQSCKKPLYRLLGGARDRVETDLTISVNPVEEMVADSLRAVGQGFGILKIKVGKEGLADVPRIRAIRQAVGPNVRLRIDANQGWNAKDAVRIIGALEDAGVDMDLVEQPVPAADFAGMQYVTAHTLTPILADESVFGPADALRVLEGRAADLINIKLMKCGGIGQALKICDIAESYGVECMMGCMLESKVSVAAAAHLAAGRRVITRADLDGPALCRVDPYPGGPLFEGSSIRMTEAPGSGILGAPCFE